MTRTTRVEVRCDRCGTTNDNYTALGVNRWRSVSVNDSLTRAELLVWDLCPPCWDDLDTLLHDGGQR